MILTAALIVTPLLAGPKLGNRERGIDRAPREPTTELNRALVRVPFGRVDRRVSVAALINGEGPYHFILDTGASGDGRIDAKIAKKLDLPIVGRVIQDDTTGRGAKERPTVAVAELSLGGATFRNVTLTASDYEWIAGEDELPVSGILGLALFRELLMTIDYPSYAIVLSRGRLERGTPNTARYDTKHGLCTVTVRIGDAEVEAILDTGSAAGLLFPESLRARVETKHPPRLSARGRLANNAFEVKSAPLRHALQICGHELSGLDVGFVDVELLPNVGYGIVGDYRITIDQKRRRVRLEDPEVQ